MSEKVRVHTLAKDLNVPSKVIVAKCQAEGVDVANHMSTLSAGLAATIREWFSEGAHATTVETSARVDLTKVRVAVKPKHASVRRKPTTAAGKELAKTQDREVATEPMAAARPEATTTVVADASGDEGAGVTPTPAAVAAETPASTVVTVVEEAPTPIPDLPIEEKETPAATGAEQELVLPEAKAPPEQALQPPAEVSGPAGPQNVPKPAQLKGPRVVRYEPVEPTQGPLRARRRPGSEAPTPTKERPKDEGTTLKRPEPQRGRRRFHTTETDTARAGKQRRGSGRRAGGTSDDAKEKLREWRDLDLAERQERISDATGRKIHVRRAVDHPQRGTSMPAAPKTEATVSEPIILRDLCAATGISLMQMLPILRRDCGLVGTINTEVPADAAEFVAASFGINLKITPAKTELDLIQEEFASREPVSLQSRAPVVAFLGHVDHGKTSLLDAMRATRETETEDGGITQHIGASHLEHKSGRVTLLDTPGHQAFTAMRARGAELTDIVVLVVAADDGVMPQTVEAINHAKAADVAVVVALNKIDLGDRNVHRIYGELSEHGLTPSGDWGGETDVIHTAAVKGQGIDDLIEHLVALGEVLDLQADYKGDAMGTVIEAETKEGVGPVVRVLVQQGMLRTGTILVCGNAYGRARALINDRGDRVAEAGPSVAVELWGLDEVPSSGDKFYQVKSLQRAKAIAEDERRRRIDEGRVRSRRARSLEDVFKQRGESEIPELNVIIKADVDGSIEALRTMLEQLPSDKVNLVIRHTGVGAVTDSDVLLADASNAIIVAFRVLPVPGGKRLAEDKGVDLRLYKIIYDVANDIRLALEGLLAPEEKHELRATCEVRDVFKVSKVGAVAGCFVTDGTVHRSHRVRLVRDGILVREGSRIASLRRFKDDAKEVRAGLECGIRIDGFDDIRAGDIIETYEVVEVAQTL